MVLALFYDQDSGDVEWYLSVLNLRYSLNFRLVLLITFKDETIFS